MYVYDNVCHTKEFLESNWIALHEVSDVSQTVDGVEDHQTRCRLYYTQLTGKYSGAKGYMNALD